MGNKYCWGARPQTNTEQEQIFNMNFRKTDTQKGPTENKDNNMIYFTFNNMISPEELNVQQDLIRANDTNDTAYLVDHLQDPTPLTQEVKVIDHPWATLPETKGSLATIYLGLIYNKEMLVFSAYNNLSQTAQQKQSLQQARLEKQVELAETFRGLSLVNKIRHNLNSSMADRQELTILLIYFLVKKNESMQQEFILNDFLKDLTVLLNQAPLIQTQILIKILKKLFYGRLGQIKYFIQLQGIEKLCAYLQNCTLEQSKTALHALNLLSLGDHSYQRDKQVLKILKEKQVVKALEVYLKRVSGTDQTINMASPSAQADKQELTKLAQCLQKTIKG